MSHPCSSMESSDIRSTYWKFSFDSTSSRRSKCGEIGSKDARGRVAGILLRCRCKPYFSDCQEGWRIFGGAKMVESRGCKPTRRAQKVGDDSYFKATIKRITGSLSNALQCERQCCNLWMKRGRRSCRLRQRTRWWLDITLTFPLWVFHLSRSFHRTTHSTALLVQQTTGP